MTSFRRQGARWHQICVTRLTLSCSFSDTLCRVWPARWPFDIDSRLLTFAKDPWFTSDDALGFTTGPLKYSPSLLFPIAAMLSTFGAAYGHHWVMAAVQLIPKEVRR